MTRDQFIFLIVHEYLLHSNIQDTKERQQRKVKESISSFRRAAQIMGQKRPDWLYFDCEASDKLEQEINAKIDDLIYNSGDRG